MTLCEEAAFPCSDTWEGNLILMGMYCIILGFGAKLIADGSDELLEIFPGGLIGGKHM